MKNTFNAVSFLCSIIIFNLPLSLLAQTTPTKTDSKIKIYLSCTKTWLCDEDFLRTELTMVDYVRDRFLCDVQVIVNTQFTEGGGEQNQLVLKGLGRFENMQDTLLYFNNPTVTDNERRQKLLQNLKLGLVRFVAQSIVADKLQIIFTEDKKEKENQTSAPNRDPWNYWQFSVGTSGYFNGDQNYISTNIYMNMAANRETEKSRFNLELSNNISRQKIILSPTEKVKINTDGQNIYMRYAYKFSEHWAYGFIHESSRSIFNNIDAQISLAPRLEYSLFPYKRFNNERITFQYSIGPEFFNYGDTTIYFKTKELLLKQRFGISSSFTKPWGNINIGVGFNNYMNDFSKNNLFISGGINWNVFKGFQVGINGYYQFIRDQISLPKLGATRDDVLTRRRLIATSFSYFTGINLNYRFGSIYNSQVHPTFKY